MAVNIHGLSDVQSNRIGNNTKIWQFTVVLEKAVIGENCNICAHVFIENDVVVGDNVTIKNGVQLWDGITVENNVFIGPNVTFTNDLYPRSKQYPDEYLRTFICEDASIGANATILPGIRVGKNAMVGAGSVVTHDVPPNAIVVGNPAYIKGYVNTLIQVENEIKQSINAGVIESNIRGVKYKTLPVISDLRGSLSFAEINQHLPFIPKRYFLVYDVPSQDVRGEHAHKELSEFLICVKGSCAVMLDDGKNREEYSLKNPDQALLIPPMVWGVQYKYSLDAVLLVLASDVYKESDYIRDYSQFLDLCEKNN